MWTWGNAEFGHAWDRNLTDEEGPYIELMAGAFTDNQPDFSWLQPYETKTVSQYWYPIQQIGPAKNANTEIAVNLEFAENRAFVGVCVTSRQRVRVLLTRAGHHLIDEEFELAPGRPFTQTIAVSPSNPHEYRLAVLDPEGRELIAYQPTVPAEQKPPDVATEPLPPGQIASIEELYLTGLHLEQYRHATRSPEDYWREGLKRDPEDSRLNNALGLTCLRKGQFATAEEHFVRAVRRLTMRNPNPYDGELFYNLGLARMYKGKSSAAYDAFHKSVWNYAWASAGYYSLAALSTERGCLHLALEQVEQSLLTNVNSLKARALKSSLLRKLGRVEDAQALVSATLALDPLDFRTMAETFLATRDPHDMRAYVSALESDVQTLLDVVFDLAWSGLRDDAYALLEAFSRETICGHPIPWYTLSWLASLLGEDAASKQYLTYAEAASPLHCFPARLDEMIVLEDALRRNPADAKANYYLGNLYYDKRRYKEAIGCWRQSVELDAEFSTPWRNLGIAEFNVLHNPQQADLMYQRAFAANPQDARVLYEWDQLKKRTGQVRPEDRLKCLDEHPHLVDRRDDFSVEYITLLNQCGKCEEALARQKARRFSPWEGGEGLVSAQYVAAHRSLGKGALAAGKPADAMRHFEAARCYPENLGEAKHLLARERDLDYFQDSRRRNWATPRRPIAIGVTARRTCRPSVSIPIFRRYQCSRWAALKMDERC